MTKIHNSMKYNDIHVVITKVALFLKREAAASALQTCANTVRNSVSNTALNCTDFPLR